MTSGRVGAIALAVALTGGILRLVRSAHPPAGATTIIVASGLLAKPRQILDILIGVLLLTIAGWCLNRADGRARAGVGSATVSGPHPGAVTGLTEGSG